MKLGRSLLEESFKSKAWCSEAVTWCSGAAFFIRYHGSMRNHLNSLNNFYQISIVLRVIVHVICPRPSYVSCTSVPYMVVASTVLHMHQSSSPWLTDCISYRPRMMVWMV